MSDVFDRKEVEVVDLDTCPKMKSILIGSLVAALLGFVGYSYMFLCIHYLLGGLAVAGHFAKRHSVTISGMMGAKMGAISAFLGMLIVFAVFTVAFYNGFGDEGLEDFRQELLRTLFEDGQPEAAEMVEKLEVGDLRLLIVGALLVAGTGLSLVLGAIGGAIGSAVFKKGPVAQ